MKAMKIRKGDTVHVLAGKDLLQGNGLSQAGGGLLQIVGIAFGGVAAGIAPPWIVVVVGAGVLLIGAIVSRAAAVTLRLSPPKYGSFSARNSPTSAADTSACRAITVLR